MIDNQDKKAIAIQILKQLGGNRFIAMTGAKNFGIMSDRTGIAFSIPRANSVKYVRIILNSMDTYDMEFLNTKIQVIAKDNDIYNDQLQSIFTARTGLYTHL